MRVILNTYSEFNILLSSTSHNIILKVKLLCSSYLNQSVSCIIIILWHSLATNLSTSDWKWTSECHKWTLCVKVLKTIYLHLIFGIIMLKVNYKIEMTINIWTLHNFQTINSVCNKQAKLLKTIPPSPSLILVSSRDLVMTLLLFFNPTNMGFV